MLYDIYNLLKDWISLTCRLIVTGVIRCRSMIAIQLNNTYYNNGMSAGGGSNYYRPAEQIKTS